ncbi:MAG: DNA replication/repair protein RecF [Propionibacteriaceae bacterium]|nr:DNA replication/repair protein RecF [Propionibacteriaceae bacterium]
MFLTHLRLADYRSYRRLDLPLSVGTTVLLGPNGYGKTNLVEAVAFLATLSSHRVASNAPLIRSGANRATIAARVQAGRDDDRCLSVGIDIRAVGSNQASLNQAVVRPRAILGAVRVVVFSPEDLCLTAGDPADRRRFIDELIISRWPRLAGVKADYDKALRQKNQLLKSLSGKSVRTAGAGADLTIDLWNETLATVGAELVAARLKTIADLADPAQNNYDAIAPRASSARVAYQFAGIDQPTAIDPAGLKEALLTGMDRRRGDELARGQSLVGPHRDELSLSLGELPVKGYASHGESWSFALSLRLASLELLQADGVEPILILDDVFAELDEQRRARVVTAIGTVDQALVTAAVAHDLPANLAAWIIRVDRDDQGWSLLTADDGVADGVADSTGGMAGQGESDGESNDD